MLDWFTSYLTNRFQFVSLGENKSSPTLVQQGVPQARVLGPILFNIYMLPLGDIIRKFGLGFHCYADDTQIYISMHPNPNLAVTALSTCLDEIKAWMHDNFLKLNQAKTELLFVGTPTSLLKLNISELITTNDFLNPSSQVRNLGVIFDPELMFEAHIKNDSKTAFFHLRNIARLRQSLSLPDAERLIHAFITSRLDYCNALYLCLPNRSIKK